MFAEQAVVLATGPSAGRDLNPAVAGLALWTNDVGRPHVRKTTSLGPKFQLGEKLPF
jgi:hypothetical protein